MTQLFDAQVIKQAKKVVTKLDAAEHRSQLTHQADPSRQKLAELYSLGHKVSLHTSCSGAARVPCHTASLAKTKVASTAAEHAHEQACSAIAVA